jgi:S1-C subfamily serine protease
MVRIVTSTGMDSGFIIDAAGYLLTNNYVVDGVETAKVVLSDGRSHNAVVMGRDLVRDMAVLKIPAGDLTVLTLGNSSGVIAGQQVIAIGYPADLVGEATTASGLVSAIRRDQQRNLTWIQIDAPINPRNSGGPLLNSRSEVSP